MEKYRLVYKHVERKLVQYTGMGEIYGKISRLTGFIIDR